MQLQLKEILPLLTSEYERGRLVPFLGAGMSAPACALWEEFVSNLERIAEGEPQEPPGASSPKPEGNRTARADYSVARLRNQGSAEELWQGLREALKTKCPMEIPPQTDVLAKTYWPLVVTTNYDDLFLAAAARKKLDGTGIVQLTRHPWHCKEVINSLVEPSGRYLWHIQGFLGGQINQELTPEALMKGDFEESTRRVPSQRYLDDLVVGHGEYRRVTNLEPQFRRCFAEVFRQRSFLFLGSSLSEEYFLNLFGEILEIYGSNPWPHFAFVKQGDIDARFLLERMNVSVCEYAHHDELPDMLDELEQTLNGSRCRPTSWSFGLNESRAITEPAGNREARFTVCRNSLPKLSVDGSGGKDCVAVSVGRSGLQAHFGRKIQSYLKDVSPDFRTLMTDLEILGGQYTARLGDTPYYAVAARNPDVGRRRHRRDLRAVREAMEDLLNRVPKDGFERIHLQLLSAGVRRVFPPLYSFTEIVRAFGAWSRREPDVPLHLLVYVVDQTVLSELSAGMVNVHELLSCDLVRFWAEVESDEQASKRVTLYRDGNTGIVEIMELLGLPKTNGAWRVTVHPPPTRRMQQMDIDQAAMLSLEEVGVVPGSTLRFTDTRRHRAQLKSQPATR
jgi:hypothetical protein